MSVSTPTAGERTDSTPSADDAERAYIEKLTDVFRHKRPGVHIEIAFVTVAPDDHVRERFMRIVMDVLKYSPATDFFTNTSAVGTIHRYLNWQTNTWVCIAVNFSESAKEQWSPYAATSHYEVDEENCVVEALRLVKNHTSYNTLLDNAPRI